MKSVDGAGDAGMAPGRAGDAGPPTGGRRDTGPSRGGTGQAAALPPDGTGDAEPPDDAAGSDRSTELLRVTLDGSDAAVAYLHAEPQLALEAGRRVRALARRADDVPGSRRFEVVVDGWRFEATVESATLARLRERVRRSTGRMPHERLVLRAPLPGRIVSVWVSSGDVVAAGQRLCSLEAMKMENEVRALRAGTIERVRVEPGMRVERGDELVVIA